VRPGFGLAAAAALSALFAAAGCGLGEGESVDPVVLTVTRDYGTQRQLHRSLHDLHESDTVMRVLDRSAEVETRYGGGFVQSIDGVAGGLRGGRLNDWFFYVNGVESSVGAAEVPLRGGERIWWDYRDWTAAMRVPAVVGSFPEPFRQGYGGERRSTAVLCRTAEAVCARVRRTLRRAGAALSRSAEGAITVLVGPWRALRRDHAAAQIEDGPALSGVFAELVPISGGWRLLGLTAEADGVRGFGPGAGLIAATRRGDGPPTWVLTGPTEGGVRAAAAALDAASLRDHYAVAIDGGAEVPLPVR
jgi:hypothetical protein